MNSNEEARLRRTNQTSSRGKSIVITHFLITVFRCYDRPRPFRGCCWISSFTESGNCKILVLLSCDCTIIYLDGNSISQNLRLLCTQQYKDILPAHWRKRRKRNSESPVRERTISRYSSGELTKTGLSGSQEQRKSQQGAERIRRGEIARFS